ncbi:MAG: DUF512 domain-containing protein [Candidatus Marinimicrobia bacterium]|jgi:putative radical SAM enzyme (TIGR03279 family)|nr:DUF512 domain-containing protein [Candidatus Neomarinimicrobiota bacterium]
MKILSVRKDSTASELGLKPGDRIDAIDGSRVRDILDYRFKISDENIILRVRQNGEIIEYDIEKDYDDDLGLAFQDFKIRSCANDCIFCFVDQNPKNMRDALYFRDGDFRMSFLYGHYVTMTNMGWKELKRVVEQRLSPLYVSVHVTEPDKRQEMFLYGKDDFLLRKFEYLTENGIEIHSQVVLCPTWNDGQYLEKTISDIHQFSPMAKSMSIVPVGLTGHREGLVEIPSVTPSYAEKFISMAHQLDSQYRHANGARFIYLSDEWYLLIGNTLPPLAQYAGADLEENGVGQVATFMHNWADGMADISPQFDTPKNITIGSGILISNYFKENFIPQLNDIEGLTVNYIPIRNEFMGVDQVTVTGLLTGKDIVQQLKGKALGEMVVFSDRILRETGGSITLDDMTLDQIGAELGVPFKVTSDDPKDFFNLINNGN